MPDVLKRVPENLPFLDHSTYCCYKIWIWCILMIAIKAWKGNPNFEDSRPLHSCPGLRSLVWTVEFNQHIPFIFLTDARLSLLTLDFVPHTCLSVMTIMNFAASKIFGAIQLYKLHSTNHSCSFKKKRTEDNCWYYFGSFISMMHGRRKHAKSSSIIICGWGCTTTSAKHTSSPHHIVTSESGLLNLQDWAALSTSDTSGEWMCLSDNLSGIKTLTAKGVFSGPDFQTSRVLNFWLPTGCFGQIVWDWPKKLLDLKWFDQQVLLSM